MVIISIIDPDDRRLAAATHAINRLKTEFFIPGHGPVLDLEQLLDFFKVGR